MIPVVLESIVRKAVAHKHLIFVPLLILAVSACSTTGREPAGSVNANLEPTAASRAPLPQGVERPLARSAEPTQDQSIPPREREQPRATEAERELAREREAEQARELARVTRERQREAERRAMEEARRQQEAAAQRQAARQTQMEELGELERQVTELEVRAAKQRDLNAKLVDTVTVAEQLLGALISEQAKYDNTDANGVPIEPLQKDLIAELEERKASLKREIQSLSE